MKTAGFFSLMVIIMFNINIYGQTFQHRDFVLNKTVTFNTVINCLEDRSQIITEPSVYFKGESIKYFDYHESITELSFFENTQVLKEIDIRDFTYIDYVSELGKSVLRQLGQPTWGYEIKTVHDVTNNQVMDDYITYEFRYVFDKQDYQISIWIRGSGIKIISKTDPNDNTAALPGEGYAFLENLYKEYGNNYYYTLPLHSFSAEIIKKESGSEIKPYYPEPFQGSWGWSKNNTVYLNKW